MARGKGPKARHLTLALSLFFLSVSFASLTEEVIETVVHLPPVPDYPKDGKIPPKLKGRFVFLDRRAGEIIVSFPENLGQPDFEKNPGSQIVERVRLAINIRPSVVLVAVQKNERGAFSYAYTVENQAGAKQDLGRWLLSLPSLEGLESVGTPNGWIFHNWDLLQHNTEAQLIRSMTDGLPASELHRIKSDLIRKQVVWVGIDNSLRPGSVRDQFQIVSQNKPGIVTAYFQGHPSKTTLSHSFFSHNETPAELGGQMNIFNFAENNSVSLSTIGPRFVPSSSPRAIAEGFLSDVERLTKENKLAPSSAFSQEILSVLKFLVQQPAESSLKQVIELKQKPTTRLESQIYQAVQLSLSLSGN